MDGLKQAKNWKVMSSLISSTDMKLHIVDGVIFFQNRIVVPVGLKCQFLIKLHESHMGCVVKSKLLARTLVYWPK